LEDLGELDMSLATRMISSITVFLLNICRFTITFIAPQHRKKIEEAMRGVNLVIVEEKYFWKMYETNAKASVLIPSNTADATPLQGSGNLAKSGFISKVDTTVPKSPKSAYGKDNILRAKVVEYILLPTSSSRLIN
jgi:hypothetical protein